MKDKKVFIGIIVAIVLIITIVLITRNINSKKNKEQNINTEINYNNETGEYYIQDENGEILHSANSESELYIYKIDPNYDAKNDENVVGK